MMATAPIPKAAASADGSWEDTYLKLALLKIDKVAFTKAFLIPTYEAKPDMPTKGGVIGFLALIHVVVYLYYTFVAWDSFGNETPDKQCAKKCAACVDCSIGSPAVVDGFVFVGSSDGNGKCYEDGRVFNCDNFNDCVDKCKYKIWYNLATFYMPLGMAISAPCIAAICIYFYTKYAVNRGRFGALMAVANLDPPKRDHSKPFAATWYKELLRTFVYFSIGFQMLFVIIHGNWNALSQIFLALVFLEPGVNAIDRHWSSSAISDCETVIAGALQAQCVFAEGASNSISINVNVLANLSWHDSAVRDEVLKAAKQKNFDFQIFDMSTGYHTSVTFAGPKIIKEGKNSVVKAVLMESFDQREQLRQMMEAVA
jgi:hypothetical protein